jgi:integrase
MSVRVVPYRRAGSWEVDIRLRPPDGKPYRERRVLAGISKSNAQLWGERRERHLWQHGPAEPMKEVPTLAEFKDRFLDGHARANRQKPSGIAAKESILTVHLVPLLGAKKLDAIGNETVQRLKHELRDRAPKTVNNVLTVLNTLLKIAVEWKVIERMPCTIRSIRIVRPPMGFFDTEEYGRLVSAAQSLDPTTWLIVLLGGDAGLRCGEMIALEWGDVDLVKRQLCVQRSAWLGQVTAPKGGRVRYVPLTRRLTEALRENRHLRSSRVICQHDGSPMTWNIIRRQVQRALKRAQIVVTTTSGIHRLRHSFCSHLAMRGAPARAIQELAGHRDLTTTERYMHLGPAAIERAIRLLDTAPGLIGRGDCGETESDEVAKSSI